MTTEYTPTTDLVRDGYAKFLYDYNASNTLDKGHKWFDRWNAPREEALAAVQRVRELHHPIEVKTENGEGIYCSACWCLFCEFPSPYPCPTIKALEGESNG
jgi:hypothetical protein